MTDFSFKKVDRPEVTVKRASEPNPFLDVVKDQRENGGADGAVEFTTPMGESFERANKTTAYRGVEKVLRQLREAGQANDCSVRTVVNLNIANNKPTKGTATVQFWTTDKITRTRSEK